MTPIVQTAIVTLLVASALGYLGARAWRAIAAARARKVGCGPSCGCG
jgi:hypothetical protein